LDDTNLYDIDKISEEIEPNGIGLITTHTLKSYAFWVELISATTINKGLKIILHSQCSYPCNKKKNEKIKKKQSKKEKEKKDVQEIALKKKKNF